MGILKKVDIIFKNRREKFFDKVKIDAKTNFEKIDNKDFKLRNIHYNFRCHLVAVQNALIDKKQDVYLCMCLDSAGYPFVHFINGISNYYIDDTLGWWGKKNVEYYIIKKLKKEEYDQVNQILLDTKRFYINKHAKFIDHFLINESDL